MYVWPKLLCSHKTWAEVSSSALWLQPKDYQLTALYWEVVMCFLKSQPLMLSKIYYFKTPRVTLVHCTVSSLAVAFQLTPMYAGPRWDSQRYDWLHSMKYSPEYCTFWLLQLYLVMSFLVVCGIAAVFSNIQYMQLLYVIWSIFRTR